MEGNRWAPLTGVAFFVLVIVGALVAGEPPGADDPVQEIVDHYQDNKDAIMAGTIMTGIAATLLVFFAGLLRRILRSAEGDRGVLSAVMFAGAIILAVGATIDATISFALAEAADDIPPESMQTLQALWDNDFMPIAVGTQIFLLAAGLSIVQHGAFPKAFGWVAIVLGLIAVTPVGFVAFLAGGLWLLVLAVLLLMRARPARPAGGDAAG